MGTCCSRNKESTTYKIDYNDQKGTDLILASSSPPSKRHNELKSHMVLQIDNSDEDPTNNNVQPSQPPQHIYNERLQSVIEDHVHDSPLPSKQVLDHKSRPKLQPRSSEGVIKAHYNTKGNVFQPQETALEQRFSLSGAVKDHCNYLVSFEMKSDVSASIFRINSFGHCRRLSSLAQNNNNNIIEMPLDYYWSDDHDDRSFNWAIFMFKRYYRLSRGYFKILDYVDDDVFEYSEGDAVPQLKITTEHLKVFLYFVHHPKLREYLEIRDREIWNQHDITIYIDEQQYILKFFNGKNMNECQALSIVKIPLRDKAKAKKIHALYFPSPIDAIEWKWYDTTKSHFVVYDRDELQNLEFEASYYANIEANFPISNPLFRSPSDTSIFDHCYLPRFSALRSSSIKPQQRYCMRYTLCPINDSDDFDLCIDQIRLLSSFARSVLRYFNRTKYLQMITRTMSIGRVLSQSLKDVGPMMSALRSNEYIDEKMSYDEDELPLLNEGTETTARKSEIWQSQSVAWIAVFDPSNTNGYHITLTSQFDQSKTSQFSVKRVKDDYMEYITLNIKEAELVTRIWDKTHIWARFKHKRNRNCVLTRGFWDISFHNDDKYCQLRHHLDAILSTLQHQGILDHFNLWNDEDDDGVLRFTINGGYEYELLWYNTRPISHNSAQAMYIRHSGGKAMYVMYFVKPDDGIHWQWYDNDKCKYIDYTASNERIQLECCYLSNLYENYGRQHIGMFTYCIFSTFCANNNIGDHKCYVLRYKVIEELHNTLIVEQVAFTNHSDFSRSVRKIKEEDLLIGDIPQVKQHKEILTEERVIHRLSKIMFKYQNWLCLSNINKKPGILPILILDYGSIIALRNDLSIFCAFIDKSPDQYINLSDNINAKLSAEFGHKKDNCLCVRRNYRDRKTHDSKEKYFGFKDKKEIVTQQLLDSYHCLLIHSKDIQRDDHDEFKDEYEEGIHNDPGLDRVLSDFFDPRGNIRNNEGLEPALDRPISVFFNAIKKRSASLTHYAETDKNKAKFNTSAAYHSGYRYYYWPYYQWNEDKMITYRDCIADPGNKNYRFCDWYINSSHHNLKEEMLSFGNDLISINQFDQEYEKATIHLQSFDGKILKCNESNWETMYGLKHGTAITINHLLSIQFYSSFIDAAICFAETFRKIRASESDEEVKIRHSKCALWAKYLRESVEGFGIKLTHQSRDIHNTYYHGITSKFLFTTTFLTFHLPLSTTINEEIIENLVSNNCMVLALKPLRISGNIRVWDSSKYSDFPWEQEHLFVGGLEPLMVHDIKSEVGINGMKGETYLYSIQAMNNIHQIFEGMACKFDIKPIYIKQLINNRLSIYRDDTYLSRLFDAYCDDIHEVIIRLFFMDQSYRKIADIFMDKDKLNLLKLVQLFPNCKRITLCDGHKYRLVPYGVKYEDTILMVIDECMDWVFTNKNYALTYIILETDEAIDNALLTDYCERLNGSGWQCKDITNKEDIEYKYQIYRTRRSIHLTRHGDECKALDRVWSALEFYETIEDHDRLVEVCTTKYKSLLDDWVHIVSEHEGDLKVLSLHNPHDIWICCIAKRHYGNKPLEDDDIEFLFYRDLLDSIHCYLHHLEDVGLRVFTKYTTMDIKEDDDDDCKDLELIHIQTTQRSKADLMYTKGLKLVDKSSKYNLMINKDKKDLLMDNLSLLVHKYVHNITNDDKHSVLRLFYQQEYDSDAIRDDAEDKDQSNLNATNSVCFVAIKSYLLDTILHSYMFSVGYRFYYDDWSQFKADINKTDKYKVYIIKAKYKSLSEEVLHNTIWSANRRQFDFSVAKAHRYHKTAKAKAMICIMDECGYGFKCNDSIQISHLLSIVLYCNLTNLQRALSGTFRKKEEYESIESVILRHSEFATWSRLLRETVEIFGMDGSYSYKNENGDTVFPGKGPFYCGMDHVMAIPEFDISLLSPTSTSKNIEVATRFGGDDGILIMLNNNGENGNVWLKSFCCAWISNHQAENEWLFCGGKYKMRIESVTMIKSGHNFGEFFRVLFYFDCMLNGSSMDFPGFNVNSIGGKKKKDRKLLIHFINHRLDIIGFKNKFKKYINTTFKAFTLHKTKIIIKMDQIAKYFADFADLILYSLNKTNEDIQYNNEYQSLLKQVLFINDRLHIKQRLFLQILSESIHNNIENNNKDKIITYFKHQTLSSFTKNIFVNKLSHYCNDKYLHELYDNITKNDQYTLWRQLTPKDIKKINKIYANILNPIIFKLFPNIQQITIHSSYQYGFHILSLLDVLTPQIAQFKANNLTITIKAQSNKSNLPPWKRLNAKIKWDDITAAFTKHGLTLTESTNNTHDQLFITKRIQ